MPSNMLMVSLIGFVVVSINFFALAEFQEDVKIPITPEIQKLLVKSNPVLFGNEDFPKHARCQCHIELAQKEENPEPEEWFEAPTENPKWKEFIESQGPSFFTSDLYDNSTNTVSYPAMKMFEYYLKRAYKQNVFFLELRRPKSKGSCK